MGQKNTLVKFSGAVSLFFIMTGCTVIGNWFDSVGEHMPVIGERCENWQCFTSSGQAISDEKKQQMQQAQQAQQNASAQTAAPAVTATPPAPAYPTPSKDDAMVHH